MHILHTESSNGWGGQEIRILREAKAMRSRGHQIFFAVATKGGLVVEARKAGFLVYELKFRRSRALRVLFQLIRIILRHKIDLVNTHSSLDSWLGGLAARFCRKKILRTRHLSTAIRPGINSLLLYNGLADFVVTTSSVIVPLICQQAKLSHTRCRSIPTGVEPLEISVSSGDVQQFRKCLNVAPDDILVGTACFVRSWKGVLDFMNAAAQLKHVKKLKWVVVGGGHVKDYMRLAKEMNLNENFIFTDHLNEPFAAIAAMDIFALLSTANEGVSQASLQAAYLERPLITTRIGGLPEVCIEGVTGFLVPPRSPELFVEKVMLLAEDSAMRKRFGENAKQLVLNHFTFESTIAKMLEVYGLML